MPTPTTLPPARQLELLPGVLACTGPSCAQDRPCSVSDDENPAPVCPREAAGSTRPDRISVDLRGLRSRLEARAARQGTTTAALVRGAVVRLLDDGCPGGAALPCVPGRSAGPVAKVTLRVSSAHAATLARRARDADVAQGQYVCALLDGTPTPPLPADHAASVAALRASNDRVAAMSADLNAFLRLLGRVPSHQLESYREGLKSLSGEMRAHLAKASALLADLTTARRPRR